MIAGEPETPLPWPDPGLNMVDSLEFRAVWSVIKNWDINVPGAYAGYCGATGNHVKAILDGLRWLSGAPGMLRITNDE